ncbi:MAG: hypothetical protein ABSF62_04840, partial [Bryobacteraceae bacterium]
MQASEVYLDIAPPALPKECEAVYSADVAITVGVLEDRVNTRVTWIKWVGGVIGTVLAFLILRSITQGEKLAEISGKLDLIVAEQRKQVPTTVSELLRKHPSDDAEKVSQRLTLAAAVLSNALAQEK